MCGIACILEIKSDSDKMRERALNMARTIRHRGPDWSAVFACDNAVLAHERLSIVDVDHGAQPLTNKALDRILAVNGEIYNHQVLRQEFADYPFKTNSDCEVILPLFEQFGHELLNKLSGIFAFVLYDKQNDNYLIARDPIGVIPLYMGRDEHGQLYVASEMKALIKHCRMIEDFPPGHYLTADMEKPAKYYQPAWRTYEDVKNNELDSDKLKSSLENAVRRQLMCDVPYGVLLSGGLDSSVIAAIIQKFTPYRVEDDLKSQAWFPRLHSFAIGLEGSPDLQAAKLVADAIGTVHHEVIYTIQDGLDAIKDVIYHTETYDVTTIRASIPMFLLARYIKAMGIKMVLSGEGADEIFGGYLYFHKAPDAREFHAECVRKIDALHKFDCLRANKSMAAWGVEVRVPFLDREFLDIAMGFDTTEKMISKDKMEKYVVRKAFENILPSEVVWRQKEQFSDGVGYLWIDTLKQVADKKISDSQMKNARFKYQINSPASKEAYMYREIFDKLFPGEAAASIVPSGKSIACSSPAAIAWDKSFQENADPSGRAVQGVHKKAK